MSNVIQIKHGAEIPPDGILQPYELGYALNGGLLIGNENGKAISVAPTITLASLGITATAAELNKLDGVTASTAELNLLKGVTASTAEINKLDGLTATTEELNCLVGVTSKIQAQLNGKQASITGAATTIAANNLTASRALISNSDGKIAASAVTSTELGYLAGVTSAIQTQLNGKQPSITGAATTITSSNLTASRALISDSSGKVRVSSITSTELGYLSGVNKNIQNQFTSISNSINTINNSINVIGDFSLLASAQTLTSGSSFTIANANNYKAFLIFALPEHSGSDYGYASILVPYNMIGTTEKHFVVSDASHGKIFSLKIDSNNVLTVADKKYLGSGIAAGSVYVYGIK